jgi:DUF4097 and DUF4098 domain-containing protein YvlB
MYEFDRSTPVTVVLRALGGIVDIVAEERLSIQVDVQPMSNNGLEAAQNTRVELEDDTLVIHVPGAEFWTWRRTPKLKITARVPLGSSVVGKTASADVRLTGVYSDVRFDVASADVEVAEVTGDVALDAASGHLSVGRAGGSVRAKSASASGDIEIGSLRQGEASIRSASGDITVGVTPGTAIWMDVNTASGKSVTDLTAQGEHIPDDQVELQLRVRTASGDIRVHRAPATTRKAAA